VPSIGVSTDWSIRQCRKQRHARLATNLSQTRSTEESQATSDSFDSANPDHEMKDIDGNTTSTIRASSQPDNGSTDEAKILVEPEKMKDENIKSTKLSSTIISFLNSKVAVNTMIGG
jgi:hypothetical protein